MSLDEQTHLYMYSYPQAMACSLQSRSSNALMAMARSNSPLPYRMFTPRLSVVQLLLSLLSQSSDYEGDAAHLTETKPASIHGRSSTRDRSVLPSSKTMTWSKPCIW